MLILQCFIYPVSVILLTLMGSEDVVVLLEKSLGPHLSGLHLDGVNGLNSREEQPTTSKTESMHKQPFIIGKYLTIILQNELEMLLRIHGGRPHISWRQQHLVFTKCIEIELQYFSQNLYLSWKGSHWFQY